MFACTTINAAQANTQIPRFARDDSSDYGNCETGPAFIPDRFAVPSSEPSIPD